MFSNTNKPKSLFVKQRFFTGECCPDESECCVEANVSTPSTSVNCAWILTYAIIDTATGDPAYTSVPLGGPTSSRGITQSITLPQISNDYRIEVYFTTLTSPSGNITITVADMSGGDFSPFTLSNPLPVVVAQGSPYTIGSADFDGNTVGVVGDSFNIETDCGEFSVEFEVEIAAV